MNVYDKLEQVSHTVLDRLELLNKCYGLGPFKMYSASKLTGDPDRNYSKELLRAYQCGETDFDRIFGDPINSIKCVSPHVEIDKANGKTTVFTPFGPISKTVTGDGHEEITGIYGEQVSPRSKSYLFVNFTKDAKGGSFSYDGIAAMPGIKIDEFVYMGDRPEDKKEKLYNKVNAYFEEQLSRYSAPILTGRISQSTDYGRGKMFSLEDTTYSGTFPFDGVNYYCTITRRDDCLPWIHDPIKTTYILEEISSPHVGDKKLPQMRVVADSVEQYGSHQGDESFDFLKSMFEAASNQYDKGWNPVFNEGSVREDLPADDSAEML